MPSRICIYFVHVPKTPYDTPEYHYTYPFGFSKGWNGRRLIQENYWGKACISVRLILKIKKLCNY